MDRRERLRDQLIGLRAQLAGWQGKMWTAMPGILQSFDATKMTCVVQPAIQPQIRDPYGNWTNVSISVCNDVPVCFPRGGGYGCTFPLAEGDEGIIIFSSRCIDAWWQSGGVQPQAEIRMHDLSDGMFVPGILSQPRKISGVSMTTAKFWSEDDAQYVELDKNAGVVNVKAKIAINLEAPTVHVQGGLVIDGTMSGQVGGGGTIDLGDANLKTTGTITQGTVELGTHTHPDPQGGNTGEPNP